MLNWTEIRNGIKATAGSRTYYVSPIGTGEFQVLYRDGDCMDLTHVGYFADMDTAKSAVTN
jgi:hypothetical protein